ncbi:hypothetical protein [Pseudoxanthomonas sacheonensis]|uniref:hypothetical protein n=1 Tax=Pseudoxanthomonas sacheonensis TaxID=443615 RepID=UPI0013D195FA|nr:hypothetical protein [Pseudoxanthomonas sacheonensis]KAF1712881.1 hypothetical protein CSC73_00935 [Pseudoxanthomonas sacheonensis]
MPVRAVSLVLAMLPMAASAVELVGKTMPPYPPGLRDVGGSCLSDSADPAHVCDFSIGLLADAGADPGAEPVLRYVVAGRMAGREGPLALWKITDAQAYPKVEKGYFWQAGSCRVDKVDDAKVIAVVRQGAEEEYLADVAWARRLDLKSGKFSVLDPTRVDCVNEGYGEP